MATGTTNALWVASRNSTIAAAQLRTVERGVVPTHDVGTGERRRQDQTQGSDPGSTARQEPADDAGNEQDDGDDQQPLEAGEHKAADAEEDCQDDKNGDE